MILCLLLLAFGCAGDSEAQLVTSVGGFVEPAASPPRNRFTQIEISGTVPATRGTFLFGEPYNTRAYRLTQPSDCGGQDCVEYVGYAYWLRMNNHVNDAFMYIAMGLNAGRGGTGSVLFQLNKITRAVTRVRNMFPVGDARQTNSGLLETGFFSFTLPYTFYYTIHDATIKAYDIVTQTTTTVFNIGNKPYTNTNNVAGTFPVGTRVHQAHVSVDDNVFSFTVENASLQPLGCGTYTVSTNRFRFYPTVGSSFDECSLDPSGRYVLSLENVGTPNDQANRIFDNTAPNAEISRLTGPNGTLGHLAMGYGYALGIDNNGPNTCGGSLVANATVEYAFTAPTPCTLIHSNYDFSVNIFNHPSHLNAKPTTSRPMSNQYFCGSGFSTATRAEEIMCANVAGTLPLRQLVVAPIMTTQGSTFGGYWNNQDYGQQPKGHLDVTGKYFLWTSNLGGTQLHAFLVEIPANLISDQSAPAPPAGVTVN